MNADDVEWVVKRNPHQGARRHVKRDDRLIPAGRCFYLGKRGPWRQLEDEELDRYVPCKVCCAEAGIEPPPDYRHSFDVSEPMLDFPDAPTTSATEALKYVARVMMEQAAMVGDDPRCAERLERAAERVLATLAE